MLEDPDSTHCCDIAPYECYKKGTLHNLFTCAYVANVRCIISGTTLKKFRGCERGFEPRRTRGYGRFSRRPRALFASQGAAALSLVLIVLEADFTALWLHLRSLSSLPFSRQAPSSSSLPSVPSQFCRRNNQTASAATALDKIN